MSASNAPRRSRVTSLALAACLASAALPAQQADPLASGFATPPATAHPRVWWHWMNGNITKEGITQDLDWMHRVGIVGFQNFDAALSTPKVVDQRLIYMQPGWQDAFRYAIEKGDSYGFEMAIAGSPGWSETGGPWVKPEQAMKKVTWSVTTVEGGKPFTGTLAPAPRETGPFGDIAQQDLMNGMSGGGNAAVPDYGKDILVIAMREPADEHSLASMHPTVTTSAGAAEHAERLYDQTLNQSFSFAASKPGQTSWVQYAFDQPVTIQSATFAEGPQTDPLALFRGESNSGAVLQSSTDGTNFTDVVRFPTAGAAEHTLDFAPLTARYFRLSYTEKEPDNSLNGMDLSDFGGAAAPSGPPMHTIAEFALHTTPRVNRFEEKAAYAPVPDLYEFATLAAAPSSVTPKTDVIDLTSKMKPDGTLDWMPPAGAWTVYRFGYSLTGITNHPAPPEATGPEVDKLSKPDVTAYFSHYLDGYKDASHGDMGATGHASPLAAPAPGGSPGKVGLQFVITDSWEAGTQNWTNDMLAEFQKRRGYDARPWMPALAGRVIGSSAESDRFLWDYRRTIEELLAENHYATLNAMLHERGMGQYGESHESGRATIGDGMEMKRYDDVPMAAMWTQKPGVNEDLPIPNADIRESASVAHIYGRPLVAAESMTAGAVPWGWSPGTLKPTADKEMAMGLNRFVIHSSVHQPLTGPGGANAGSPAPGLTLGPFGQWFNRNENWAEQATPWITYLSRASYMLQQGRFVADIAYYYGEDSNVTAIFEKHNPQLPEGHNFDFVNADILEHMLKVDHGDLTTASGMRYRVLVLDPYATHMSLPVLRRIAELVHQGATVVGQAPTDDPSLADNQAEFHKLVAELWGATPAAGAPRKVGKGRVLATSSADLVPSITAAFNAINFAPDTTYTKTSPDTQVLFVHRTMPGADLYFVDNRSDRPLSTEASFLVTGRAAELFHPDTGTVTPAAYTIANGRTNVPLTLEPWGTVFVVFRHATTETTHMLPRTAETELATVTGPWELKFEDRTPKPEGEPATLQMAELGSLSDNSNPAVKYFCGHITYTKHIDAPADWLQSGSPVMLDLGDVRNLAEVTVNGKPLGIVWKAPYQVDVSSAMHAGDNTVEVRVANLWVNRLIGDAQPGATKVTFTAHNPYKANSPLVPSGLIGPVRLLRETPQP